MFHEITQENLPLLIPHKAAEITKVLRRDRKLSLKAALLTFYHSSAYAMLEKENTKLWHRSAAQIYAEFFPKEPPKKTYQNGPGRSKLAPHREQILAWRKQGLSLQTIAEKLQTYGCHTTAQNIWRSLHPKKH